MEEIKVRLAPGIIVDASSTLEERARLILEYGERYKILCEGSSSEHDERLVELEGLEVLLQQEIETIELNRKLRQDCYSHLAVYKGNTFIAFTENPIKRYVKNIVFDERFLPLVTEKNIAKINNLLQSEGESYLASLRQSVMNQNPLLITATNVCLPLSHFYNENNHIPTLLLHTALSLANGKKPLPVVSEAVIDEKIKEYSIIRNHIKEGLPASLVQERISIYRENPILIEHFNGLSFVRNDLSIVGEASISYEMLRRQAKIDRLKLN